MLKRLRFSFGPKGFKNFDDLVYFHWKLREPIGDQVQAILITPMPHQKCVYKVDDIQIISKIGDGNFGEVFKVRIVSANKLAAMKTLRSNVDDKSRDNFIREMNMMNTMKHENVVQCIGMVEDPQQIKILIELINKGSLDKLLMKHKLTERGKLRVIWHVAKGMQYLHKHSIIHRDLASRNILVHRNEDSSVVAKVSDFGLSRLDEFGKGYELTTAQKLPLKWMAPECFTRRLWTTASDVWSFGILIWEVFTDALEPYSDMEELNTATALIKFVSDGGHPAEIPDVSSSVTNLMIRCWAYETVDRPTMAKIILDMERLYPMILV